LGGAGLGKTTLLAQALAENDLAPRGLDVWVAVERVDADGARLVEDMQEALGGTRGDDPVAALAAAVWSQAPSPVCFVLDDIHRLGPETLGHACLVRLLDELPANGHLLMAARHDPGFRLARLEAAGAALVVNEEDLRFTDDELSELAALGGVDVADVAPSGGWPALAQLAVRAGPSRVSDFLWEEVLEPMGPERRQLLAVLSDIGGADDALATSAAGRSVELAGEMAGVPLVAASVDGWYQPHALWRSVDALRLDPATQAAIRRRAVAHLAREWRFDRAFELVAGSQLWDLAPDLFRDACRFSARPEIGMLDRWLRIAPDDVVATAGGRLAAGVRDAMIDPPSADAPLREAIEGFQAAGDIDGEVAAAAQLGRLLWWRTDLASLLELLPRIDALARSGNRAAKALSAMGHAFISDVQGDDAAMAAQLASVHGGTGDLRWDAVLGWLRSLADSDRGDASAALATLAALQPVDDPSITHMLETVDIRCRWWMGEIDAVDAAMDRMMATVEASGVAQNIALTAASVAQCLVYLDRLDEARALLSRARELRPKARGNALVTLALAEASLSLSEGDEDAATELLRAELARQPLETGPPRRRWRESLPLTYVLLPETRDRWDALPLHGHYFFLRNLAVGVVAARAGGAVTDIDVSDLNVVRAALHPQFAAELATALHAAGRSEGAALFDALGSSGREVARAMTRDGDDRAARLLAAVPAAPAQPLKISVLGPLRVEQGNVPTDPAEFRRERVRRLLAFLVSHRTVTREATCASLWPDLDDGAAVNNLRVTLSLLHRALEPARPATEPPYFVRTEDDRLRLVSVGAEIDVDVFDAHLRAARDAERDATPSVALPHYRAALACYRGDLYCDIAEADWFQVERERYRVAYIESAVRAAQLVAAVGDIDEAEALASAALAADAWSESAAAVLVATALARGNRSAAHQRLQRCHDIATELGVEPSEETRRLQRQLRSAT
jgi:DNA-binding SARP family transcriptional activator